MPVLYPVAVINFMFLYWIYKYLILKHYKKTSSFNEDLPFMSINFFKIGLLLHIIWTVLMFTETHLLAIDLTKDIFQIGPEFAFDFIDLKTELKNKAGGV